METLIQSERLLYRFIFCLQPQSNPAPNFSKIAQEFSAVYR